MMDQKVSMEKTTQMTDEQRSKVYAAASRVSKEVIEEACPALLRIVLNSEKGPLKNELGRVIFHLQKTETLNSRIGLEKLLDAALMVAPEEAHKILEDCDNEGQELSKTIKTIL